MNTLAIDIGGTNFSLAVFEDDHLVARHSQATNRQGGPDWMTARILERGGEWRKSLGFERCGIGFGGPVIFGEQRIALSTHVGGWSGYPLTAELERELGVPCVMDNDGNAGALGEAVYGAGAGCDPLFYVTISTGIGGGLICGGQVIRGADSYAGEIGHLTVRPGGPECLCGARGCLERMCCGLWIERDYGRTAEEMFRDEAFVRRYVVDLALGLKSCIMLVNPARIVIGGGISKAGDRLFGPLREELGRQITSWSGARVDVVPAKLGGDSVLYGALALAGQAGPGNA